MSMYSGNAVLRLANESFILILMFKLAMLHNELLFVSDHLKYFRMSQCSIMYAADLFEVVTR